MDSNSSRFSGHLGCMQQAPFLVREGV
uniref:Uncharacterized protein n=1 Tax=Musa acuminata subsp. malaccensis TaxID=214687 RepID=A0A804JAR0_MUSAM